jgi:predicted ArsR family transcriptional regulator
MVDIEAIPAEARWKIGASATNDMVFAYRLAFMEATKGAYEEELNEALEALWRQAGERQAVIARAYNFPRDNARQVAEAFSTISRLFLGPELAGSSEPVADDRAVVITNRCPMVSRARKFGIEGRAVCRSCMAYTAAAVESLNPGYEVRTTRGLCMGDPFCEMHIRRRA